MHPLLSSRARLGTYLAGWVPIVAMFTAFAAVNHTPWPAATIIGFVGASLAALLFLSSYYLCLALPVTSTNPGLAVATWALASMAMGSLWAALLFIILRTLSRLYPPLVPWGVMNLPNLLIAGTIGSIFYILVAALHYILIAMEERRAAERAEQEMRVLAREAELKALRAQLNPHFLFNSLNSISALTTIDPARARKMCVLLSDFLRKSLKLGEQSFVPLSEELDLLRSYLAIEEIRFGERLKPEWDIPEDATSIQVPALLLQPLVENAIKHGISVLPEGGSLRISAKLLSEDLELRVENSVDADAETPKGLGMGLRQVRQRLLGRYGPDILFEAGLSGDRYHVRMSFPQTNREKNG